MYKILIIEDDPIISEEIKSYLGKWGYSVEGIKDFRNVVEECMAYDPQLVLMDIGLPFFNGYHWCSELRKLSKVPIIFLSSMNDDMNIVMAMNMGGDDFITKPFRLEVLQAKIQAMLRRTYDFQAQSSVLQYKGIFLNVSEMSITSGDKKIELTKNELRIMELLFEQQGQVVTRDVLMKKLWDSDWFVDDNTLSVNVGRIRKKLQDIGLEELILTKKGVGYVLGELND
ncbi:MAG: response regulator transcription factor [Cellulosilyticaceae bacterium]